MFLCDYITDWGIVQKRAKPYIYGYDPTTNTQTSINDIILLLSAYISMDGYYEVGDKEGVCKYESPKRRRITVELVGSTPLVAELEYWRPLTDLDWTVFESENVKVEVQGEKLRHAYAELLRKQI